MLNRICLSLGLLLSCTAAWGQTATISSVRISTDPSGARFYVDGQLYHAPQVFLWPAGSKHIVQFPTTLNRDGSYTPCHFSNDQNYQYCLTGWTDSTGTLASGAAAAQTFTASPGLTWITAGVRVLYKVNLRFMDPPLGDTAAPRDGCASPGDAPQDYLRTGIVFLGGNCYGWSTNLWVPGGAVALNAIPYPGFVFIGWNINGATFDSYLKTFNIDRVTTILAQFAPAKRVQFITDPVGMNLLIDRTKTPTAAVGIQDLLSPTHAPCRTGMTLPPAPPITISALCLGEFDFQVGSKHMFAAVTPQLDRVGKWWVFDRFSNGIEQNGVYTADTNTSVRDVITAKFVPGVQAAFLTNPVGLKLKIDGRDNWQSYSFVWALDSTHTVTAPATQVDASGRTWTFQGWSNGGSASQGIVADGGFANARLVANYSGLGQVKILTNPSGVKLMVDGGECTTPCTINKEPGAEISISAPASVAVDDTSRLNFLGWSDGAASTRSYRMTGDSTTIFANYGYSYRLLTATDPENGADIHADPSSADGFFPAGQVVTLTATVRSGFKFRRWNGDAAGLYNVVQVTMSCPQSVIVSLDRVPYIAPAGVKNAAGETPDDTVAPGSIIAIYGESLAPRLEVGPSNPLAQTIADVVVTVNDRILPLLFVSPRQINAQVLSDLPDGDYTLKVQWTGKPDVIGTFTISRNAPGLFTKAAEDGRLLSVALHEDGSAVTDESPARRGELVTIYGTGFGPYRQKVIDGFILPDPSNYELADSVELNAGDVTLQPDWTGGAPGFVGTMATRFRVTDQLPSSRVDLKVTINGKCSNVVALPVE